MTMHAPTNQLVLLIRRKLKALAHQYQRRRARRLIMT
jgi:hypothetical protein